MEVNGKVIANAIYSVLRAQINTLKTENITPTLAVILVGENPASIAYIKQKTKRAEEIGAQVILYEFEESIKQNILENKIKELNEDKLIHGIIIQLPLPKHIDQDFVVNNVDSKKDIDGFVPNSPFTPPVALAVLEILRDVISSQNANKSEGWQQGKGSQQRGDSYEETSLESSTDGADEQSNRARLLDRRGQSPADRTPSEEIWLKQKNIVVIGKGKSGGGPIIQTLKKIGVEPNIIDSKTQNRKELLKNADIIISAVGKPNVFTSDELKPDIVVIGVGQHKENDGKFHGDFNEEEIAKVASFYTPTPGGVGVVNVACLLKNLVLAANS